MIENKTKKVKLDLEIEQCNSIFSKCRGLMFRKNHNKALVFDFGKEKRISFHSFFVFFSFEMVFLDSSNKVVEIKKKFVPCTCYTNGKKALKALELPVGTIEKMRIKLSDIIKFI